MGDATLLLIAEGWATEGTVLSHDPKSESTHEVHSLNQPTKKVPQVEGTQNRRAEIPAEQRRSLNHRCHDAAQDESDQNGPNGSHGPVPFV